MELVSIYKSLINFDGAFLELPDCIRKSNKYFSSSACI